MEAGMFEYNKEEQSVDLDFFQGTFGILTITTIICQSHSNTDCLSTPSFSPVIGLLLMLVYVAFWLTRGRCVTSLWQIWQMGDAAQLLSEVWYEPEIFENQQTKKHVLTVGFMDPASKHAIRPH